MSSVAYISNQNTNSPHTLIASLCHHDVIFAVSAFKTLSVSNSDVRIITDSKERLECIITLLASLGISQSDGIVFVTSNLHSDFMSASNLYLFTLGTFSICSSVLAAWKSNTQIYYLDCYFDDQEKFLIYVL